MDVKNNLDKILNVVKEIIPLREAYLFGSYAYGNPNEKSDIDLYFVADVSNEERYETIVKIRRAIYGIAEKSVDVLLNNKEMFDYRAVNRATLEYKILNEGVKLYG